MAGAARKVISMNNIMNMVKDDDIIYYANEAFKTPEGKLTFSKGQELEVLEKSPNGWWFVRVGQEEGWVPSNIVQRHRGHDIIDDKELMEGQKYKTLGGYKATEDTGISFQPGQIAIVLEKDPAGWWFVKIGDDEGWAPSTFLGEIDETKSATTLASSSSGKAPAPKPTPRQSSKAPAAPPSNDNNNNDGNEEGGEAYITLSDYQDSDEGMLNFKKGQRVSVLEKDDGGWWMAKLGSETGWVPSNYLKKV